MMVEVQIERDSGRKGMTRGKRWGKRIAIAPVGLFFGLILLNLAFCGQLQAAKVPLGLGQRCESCHDGYAFQNQFPESVHGNNGCTSCHAGIKDISRHINGQYKPVPVSCKSCHQEIDRKYRKSVHFISQNIQCQDCHSDIHALKKTAVDKKRAVMDQCTTCHPQAEYSLLGHGQALLKGNQDSATCSDCHGLHEIPAFQTGLKKDMASSRAYYTGKCKNCHADEALTKRNKLSTHAVSSYDESYHGKVHSTGKPQRVAGCADCHTGHNILPRKDPRSTLYPDNLYNQCGQCHQGIRPRFVSFEAHPDPKDFRKYPLLYGTNLFMIGLLAGTFLFFWVHTLLWWRKTYVQECALRKTGMRPESLLPECDAVQQVQRFSVRDRIMHVLLILSFFTLVTTGFPLKYYYTAWAKIMINVWGGPVQAGLYHRAAAAVLIGLFLYTFWLSLRFLFPDWKIKGWISRLLGPDSLCPNLKDWDDIQGMFRWFFNRGEMPKFDRWTYWEKFDFFAVFWGMTAIGGSGLMLWFPEASSYIFPGWFLNVATVVHSEEAFLAAVFIFTVHFFNNHLVPNKFPLEPNIFTGRYKVESLQHERPLEYERLVAEGRLDALKREGPGLLIQFLSSLFGLASLLFGLLLTGLIFWAAFFY
jgi:cytochrome b subunit of formate dehydrogenase